MSVSEAKGTVRKIDKFRWIIKNNYFEISILLSECEAPFIFHFANYSLPDTEWASEYVVGPTIEVDGVFYCAGPP